MVKNDSVAKLMPPVGSVALFLLATAFAPVLTLSASTMALLAGVSVATVAHYGFGRISRTPLDSFFENANISINNKYPVVLKKIDTDNGCEYRVRMPAGASTKDFERIQLAMEQYFDASITIGYEHKQMVINVNIQQLKPLYKYELIQTAKKLMVCMGYTLDGKLYLDLEKAKHLLIGAETGGGKSSLLRSLITSYILLKDVDLYLTDFQRVEMGIFRKSSKVKSFCTNALEFSQLLASLQRESDRRLDLFEAANVSSIASYNKISKNKLRYKIIVVDEFATMMEEKHIHDALSLRLAQDRKCGFCYILATQYPIVKVIPNLIKQNMSRCAFKVKDDTASQVILDMNGAEKLRDGGHGLLKIAGDVQEFQAMYLSETDAYSLVQPTFVEKKKGGVKNANVKRPPNYKIY